MPHSMSWVYQKGKRGGKSAGGGATQGDEVLEGGGVKGRRAPGASARPERPRQDSVRYIRSVSCVVKPRRS